MQAQIAIIVSALTASVVAHPAAPEIALRETSPTKLPALSWTNTPGIKDWLNPYAPGPNGYIQWTAKWDVFASADYVPGLPGFAVSCSGTFASNNPLVGAWTLCSGFPGSATVEGQLTGPAGFLASVRHNVTQNGKTTVVVATGPGGSAAGPQFEFTVQSVETVG